MTKLSSADNVANASEVAEEDNKKVEERCRRMALQRSAIGEFALSLRRESYNRLSLLNALMILFCRCPCLLLLLLDVVQVFQTNT